MPPGEAVGAPISFVQDSSDGQQYYIVGIPRNDVI